MDSSIKLQAGKLYKFKNCYDNYEYFFLTKVNDTFIYYYNLHSPDIIEYDVTMWAEDAWEEV